MNNKWTYISTSDCEIVGTYDTLIAAKKSIAKLRFKGKIFKVLEVVQ